MIPAYLLPIRKVAVVAISALLSAAGFLAWLAGTGSADWRGWIVVVLVAVVPPVVAYLVPEGSPSAGGWWPLRKIGAALLSALIASTAFLAWIAGTGGASVREVLAVLIPAILPTLFGYLVPSSEPQDGEPLAPEAPDFITA